MDRNKRIKGGIYSMDTADAEAMPCQPRDPDARTAVDSFEYPLYGRVVARVMGISAAYNMWCGVKLDTLCSELWVESAHRVERPILESHPQVKAAVDSLAKSGFLKIYYPATLWRALTFQCRLHIIYPTPKLVLKILAKQTRPPGTAA